MTLYFADHDANVGDTDEYTATPDAIVIHPSYDGADYDFALIHISTPLDFTNSWKIQKVCLPTDCSDGCDAGTTAYIAGWGTLDYCKQLIIHFLDIFINLFYYNR